MKPHRMPKKRCKERYTPNQKSSTPGINPPTSFSQRKNYNPSNHPLYCMNVCENNMYLSVRIDNFHILSQTREEHPLQEDAARMMAEAAPGSVERDEQGRAHRANTTWSGLYFKLGRLRLKSWSKSDFSIADAPWPTNLCIHLLSCRFTKIPVREQRRERPRGGTNFPSTCPRSTTVASATILTDATTFFPAS